MFPHAKKILNLYSAVRYCAEGAVHIRDILLIRPVCYFYFYFCYFRVISISLTVFYQPFAS